MEINNLYFIEDEIGNIKIGISKDPKKRKEELQVGNFSLLKIIYIIENVPFSFEKHVHTICQKYKINGEWFELGIINHLFKTHWFKEHMIKK